MIGIIAAMNEELEFIVDRVENKEKISISGINFIKGTIANKEVIMVVCGIGKVNAAMITTILINVFKVKSIINTGVAGGLANVVEVMDLVIAKDLVYHDFRVGADYKDGQVPRMNVYAFPTDSKLNNIAYNIAEKHLKKNNVYIGRIVSGDVFLNDSKEKLRIRDYFDAMAVEMESTAIAHVCYLNNIPCIILRYISDLADNVSHIDFDKFVEQCSMISADILVEIVKEMN